VVLVVLEQQAALLILYNIIAVEFRLVTVILHGTFRLRTLSVSGSVIVTGNVSVGNLSTSGQIVSTIITG